MSDIALTWDDAKLAADVSILDNDLATDTGLETAALISLFTDRAAESGDVLPVGETLRRGWWGDAHPTVADDKIGSRLWLLDRSKQTPDVLVRAEEYARECLAWMLEDLVLERLDVVTEFRPAPDPGLAIEITFHRPNTDPVKFRFNCTWSAQAEARP